MRLQPGHDSIRLAICGEIHLKLFHIARHNSTSSSTVVDHLPVNTSGDTRRPQQQWSMGSAPLNVFKLTYSINALHK